MNVTTKKYELKKNKYLRLGMNNLMREQWWVFLIALALCGGYFLAPSIWWFIGVLIALFLYLLFWLIQLKNYDQ